MMEAEFIRLLDFTAREIVEVICVHAEATTNPVNVDDPDDIADRACKLIDNHDVSTALKERVKAALAVK